MNLKPYEAIIIGSGATGGIAALTLAEKGVRVLVIEAGKSLSAKSAFGSEPKNTISRINGIVSGSHRRQAQHPGYWKNNPFLYANEKENPYLYPPNEPFLFNILGVSNAALSSFSKAIKFYKRAISLNPEYFEVYNNMGVAYNDWKKPEFAIKSLNEAIRINPSYAEAFNNLGKCSKAKSKSI